MVKSMNEDQTSSIKSLRLVKEFIQLATKLTSTEQQGIQIMDRDFVQPAEVTDN